MPKFNKQIGIVFILVTLTLAVPQVLKIQNINEKAVGYNACACLDSKGVTVSGSCKANNDCDCGSNSPKTNKCGVFAPNTTVTEVSVTATQFYCADCGGFYITGATQTCAQAAAIKCGATQSYNAVCTSSNEGQVVVYSSGANDYRKCVNNAWTTDCGGKTCTITDLKPADVPVYLKPDYDKAVLALVPTPTPTPNPTPQSNASLLAQQAKEQYAAIPKCTFSSPRCSSDGKNVEICNSAGEMLSAGCGTFGCTNGKCNPPVLITVAPTPKSIIPIQMGMVPPSPISKANIGSRVAVMPTIVPTSIAKIIIPIQKGVVPPTPTQKSISIAVANVDTAKPSILDQVKNVPINIWNHLIGKPLIGTATGGNGTRTNIKTTGVIQNTQTGQNNTVIKNVIEPKSQKILIWELLNGTLVNKTSSTTTSNTNFKPYFQWDKNLNYDANGNSIKIINGCVDKSGNTYDATMSMIGCGPTSVANIINSTSNNNVNPLDLAKTQIANGDMDCGGTTTEENLKILESEPYNYGVDLYKGSLQNIANFTNPDDIIWIRSNVNDSGDNPIPHLAYFDGYTMQTLPGKTNPQPVFNLIDPNWGSEMKCTVINDYSFHCVSPSGNSIILKGGIDEATGSQTQPTLEIITPP